MYGLNLRLDKRRNARTANGRFGKIAALAPQKRQCELGSYYPAGTLVKPLPRQADGLLCASSESAMALRRDEYN